MNMKNERKHITPKKSLGQNFLIDKNVVERIVAALKLQPDNSLLEIGPGEGALTSLLATKPLASFLAVEYDPRAVALLSERLPAQQYPHFSLRQDDIRNIALQQYAEEEFQRHGKKLKVVGNIPYHLTSDILFWLYDASSKLDSAVIMMQKEVARRLIAPPRTKDYGILTVATALRASARILFDVAPGSFYPRPAVTSSVVALTFPATALPAETYTRLKPLVNAAFNQRRKVLSNALKTYITSRTPTPYAEILERAESQGILYFRKRAEELTPQDFITLHNFLSDQTQPVPHI